MENNYIGNIIFYERSRRNLAVADVCRGLCDRSVYSRIENGSYKGEIHLIIAVLQRLGISGSKVGRYLCRDEYDEMDFRFEILEYIKSYQLDEAKDALAEYSDRYCKGSILNTQFAEYMEARINEINGNLERALDLYKKAAAYTVADYSTCSSFVCISVYEYFMIANVARLTARFGNSKKALSLYGKLLSYCKNPDNEKWNTTCMYAKTICEMMEIKTPQMMGNYERQKWLEECDAALRILRDTSRLHFLCPLLKNKKSLTELLGMAPDKQWDDFLMHYERLRKCSLSIPSDRSDGITRYKFGISGELLEWYPYYIDCAFYPVEKLIDERRRLHGVTIEELADGICTSETVSRIINRRVSPKYSTVAALLDKLGLKGVLRQQVIVSEDLEAHKLWSALARCEDMNDSVTAKEIYEKMNNILDCSLKINRMVLEYQRIKLFEHSIDSRQLAHKYETILGMPIKNIIELQNFIIIQSGKMIYTILGKGEGFIWF